MFMQYMSMSHLAHVDFGLGTWDIAMNKTDNISFLYKADLLEGDRQISGTHRMLEDVNVPWPLALPHL